MVDHVMEGIEACQWILVVEYSGLCGCEVAQVHAASLECTLGRSGATAISRPLEVGDDKFVFKHAKRLVKG